MAAAVSGMTTLRKAIIRNRNDNPSPEPAGDCPARYLNEPIPGPRDHSTKATPL